MDINKYEGYFHDGTIIDIVHEKDKIIFSLSSAEVDPDDFNEEVKLSYNDRIIGKLYVEGVKNIEIVKQSADEDVDDHSFHGQIVMLDKWGTILDLEIQNNQVKLLTTWHSLYSPRGTTYLSIIIHAEKIYWVNIPDLEDPYWRTVPDDHGIIPHYHRVNPKMIGKRDKYLDKDGNQVAHGNIKSYLYNPKVPNVITSAPKDLVENVTNLTIDTHFFHDGDLIAINHTDDKIEFSISSAEINPSEIRDNIPISPDNRVKGKLHLSGIKSIIRNRRSFTGIIKMDADTADIFYLEIWKSKVHLHVYWESFRPKFFEEGSEDFVIEADTIYWEPIPDLVDPFW